MTPRFPAIVNPDTVEAFLRQQGFQPAEIQEDYATGKSSVVKGGFAAYLPSKGAPSVTVTFFSKGERGAVATDVQRARKVEQVARMAQHLSRGSRVRISKSGASLSVQRHAPARGRKANAAKAAPKKTSSKLHVYTAVGILLDDYQPFICRLKAANAKAATAKVEKIVEGQGYDQWQLAALVIGNAEVDPSVFAVNLDVI